MKTPSLETTGVRCTGWAALARGPQEDVIEYICPLCRHQGRKAACGDRANYYFRDGFLQDVNGESATCGNCRASLRVTPVVLVHDHKERQRVQAVFAADLSPVALEIPAD